MACNGIVAPTGGRSRMGSGPASDVAWHAWRETGVCTTCGAVHRRVVGLADAAWEATGMMARALGQAQRVSLTPAVTTATALPLSISKRVAVPPPEASASGLPSGTIDLSVPRVPDSMDYATLSIVLAILFGVAALTKDAQETALAAILTYAVLTWEPSRAVLLRMLRDMQGRS
jgi:hypothetical protein